MFGLRFTQNPQVQGHNFGEIDRCENFRTIIIRPIFRAHTLSRFRNGYFGDQVVFDLAKSLSDELKQIPNMELTD